MDKRKHLDNAHDAVHALHAGGIFSTPGDRGTVVRCLRGQAWVTQEGDARDYFVSAHTRFQAALSGTIVVNALVDHTEIAVLHTDPAPRADWLHNVVRLDGGFFEAAGRQARRERADFMAALIADGWRGVRRVFRRVAERASLALLSLRTRRECHH